MEAPGVLVNRDDPTKVFLGQARSQACLFRGGRFSLESRGTQSESLFHT